MSDRHVRIAKLLGNDNEKVIVDVVFNNGIRVIVTPAKSKDGFLFERIMSSIGKTVIPMNRFNQKKFDAYCAGLSEFFKNPSRTTEYEFLKEMITKLIIRENITLQDSTILQSV